MLRGGFPDADLYIFPELYLTGEHPFVRPPSGYDENAQAIPGPLTRAIGRIAKRAARWIVAGSIVERVGDSLYNTAVVFGPSGRLVARYRKIFTWRPFEPYAVGTEAPPVFSIPNVGKVGVMICYDGWFPEMARSLALRGAEVIAHPTLTSTPDREEELVLARANAITNQCYVVNPNAVITSGEAGASVSIPKGACCSRAARERSSSPRYWTSTACGRCVSEGHEASIECWTTCGMPRAPRSRSTTTWALRTGPTPTERRCPRRPGSPAASPRTMSRRGSRLATSAPTGPGSAASRSRTLRRVDSLARHARSAA